MNNATKIKHSICLLLAAIVWGISFVSQKNAMAQDIGAFTFNGIRLIVGSLVLIPVVFIIRKKEGIKNWDVEKKKSYNKNTIIGGICCGLILCLASNLQQFGIKGIDAGKTGFITALYIVEVPLIGLLFKKKSSWLLGLSVPLAVVGLYLLCMVGGTFSFSTSELLVLCCSVIFAVHIMTIDHFAPKADCVAMSCIQFAVAGVISLILMLFTETPDLSIINNCWLEILYAGIGSCGIAYTLQIVGQKNMDPTVSALLLSLESCVSVLSGWIILKETLSLPQVFGCIIMFIAIILAQIPLKSKNKKINIDENENLLNNSNKQEKS